MNQEDRIDRLSSSVAGAASGCPGAERLAEHAGGEISGDERGPLGEHLSGCAVCAGAVADLCEVMKVAPERSGARIPSAVSGRLGSLLGSIDPGVAAGSAPPVEPLPPATGGWASSMLRMAAGPIVAGALALLVWQGTGEGLVQKGPGGLRAPPALELIAPLGELRLAPARISWVVHPRAASYRVLLLDSAMQPVWEGETGTPEPFLELGGGAGPDLLRGAWYTWQVVALGDLDEEIERSAAGHFRLKGSSPPG